MRSWLTDTRVSGSLTVLDRLSIIDAWQQEMVEFFERNGNDVYCAIPISVSQAALGAELSVWTLEDSRQARLRLPPGTQHGKVFRLKGEGIPLLKAPQQRGDLYVKVLIQVLTLLSPKARSLHHRTKPHRRHRNDADHRRAWARGGACLFAE